MAERETPPGGELIEVPIDEEVKQAYIDYSMSVIVSRALPDVRDGLKPVHRRILYAMNELHLYNGGATRKCAKIVGDVLGKYHPHGDASVYDALVRLGQDFAERYPLITPQGNFGTIAGDPAAAYRYTEAKMAKLSEEMVSDIDKETVDMMANFDETAKEPVVLPAKFPFLLCNGTTGIAVGMATNMPPHNLREVSNAVKAYIDNPDIEISELCKYIKGPDFPTGGVIYGRKGIKRAYLTGRGKITVRGKWETEELKSGKQSIVFTEVPYGVNTTNLVSRIKELAQKKEIEGIVGINDETSDRTGMRIVIDLKRGIMPRLVVNSLFAKTALQSTFGVINLALVDSRPRVLNLKEIIKYFVAHRDEVITRRTEFDLRKAKEKEHILSALIVAVDNVDEVIRLIRGSENVEKAREALCVRFGFDEVQSQAILDMQLKRLTHLQIADLKREMEELKALIAHLEDLLSHHEKILSLIKDDMNELSEKYGDERRTQIIAEEAEEISIEDMIREEEMVILLSKVGYLKRIPVTNYKKQGRGGKGVNSTALLEDDYINHLFLASTHAHLVFVTNAGKAYWIKVYEIPELSKGARGTHVNGLFGLAEGEEITAVQAVKDFSAKEYFFMITKNGIAKRLEIGELANAKRRGIRAISLDEGDSLQSAILTDGKSEVFVITRRGKALRYGESSVRAMGRATRGVTGIKLAEGDFVAGAVKVMDGECALLITGKGFGKRVMFDSFMVHARNTSGQRIFGGLEKKGEVVGCLSVSEEDEIVCVSEQGKTLRVKSQAIPRQGSHSTGVRVVSLSEGDMIMGFDKVSEEDDEINE